MSSKRQIAANRRNALRSTGPRTRSGKATVAANAMKHGLTARSILLPNESVEEFESFREKLLADLNPLGALQESWAEQFVEDRWRLRRIPVLEASIYTRAYREALAKQPDTSLFERQIHQVFGMTEPSPAGDPKAHQDAQGRLAGAHAELDDQSLQLTRALETQSPALQNLWRHEAAVKKSLLSKSA